MYHQTAWNNHANVDVEKQLHFIGKELKNNAAEEMQNYYPEGYFFSHVLYGLTLCQFLSQVQDNATHDWCLSEISNAQKALSSPKGKAVFPEDLHPTHGIFYAGWTNYLLAQKLTHTTNFADSLLFEKQCEDISKAFKESPLPFLESYIGLSWPCDNIVAMASLALHDKLYAPKFEAVISTFITTLQSNLDKDGMIPHKTDYQTGKIIEQAKGSSQSLMLVFLIDIDSTFAKAQFQKYKLHFLDKRLGLYGVREHKKSIHEGGDIDSGPVIWEIGGSASVVGAKTYEIFGEASIAESLRKSLESFGMAYQNKSEKKISFRSMDSGRLFYCLGQWKCARKQNSF